MSGNANANAVNANTSATTAVQQLEKLEQQMIKVMTEVEGLEFSFQGRSDPIITGKGDARNMSE
jgi:hypothetical protein